MGYLAAAIGDQALEMVEIMARRLRHRCRSPRHVKPVVRKDRRLASGNRAVSVVIGSHTRADLPAGLRIPSGCSLPARQPEAVFYDGHPPDAYALAATWSDGTLLLARGALGLRPLYYLEADGAPTLFASEIKAFSGFGGDVRTFPPGHVWVNGVLRKAAGIRDLARGAARSSDAGEAAGELATLLETAIERSLPPMESAVPVGVFLSGGVDSSVIASAAAARIGVGRLRSFVVGTAGAEDVAGARAVAEHLGLAHEELILTEEDIAAVLPEVIYHLESFDAPLVRSSAANYFAARMASRAGCRFVLCGEGGDELFAGYSYLKRITPRRRVADELLALLEASHANGFQRVDRMTAAFGLEARVPLSAPDVVAFALKTPLEWKIHPRSGQDKWLLREAFRGRLPATIIDRPKAKFYEGAGTGHLLSRLGERLVDDEEFKRNRGRVVAPAVRLRTKEDMLYYRLFRARFPDKSVLETIGWTRTVD